MPIENYRRKFIVEENNHRTKHSQIVELDDPTCDNVNNDDKSIENSQDGETRFEDAKYKKILEQEQETLYESVEKLNIQLKKSSFKVQTFMRSTRENLH